MIKGLVVVAAIAGAGAYYFYVHPPVVLKRETAKSLAAFSDAVATRDRTKISQALGTLLSDNAKIRLEVNFFSITNNKPAMMQDFDKTKFITFIDNTLYPLTDYMYDARLKKFKLADDKQSADVSFTSKEWADGTNMLGGVSVNMRFSSETICDGKVIFATATPQLSEAVCKMQFRSVPKPGEAERLNNMEGLRDLLIQQR